MKISKTLKSTVRYIRTHKTLVFSLLFNSLFLIGLIVAVIVYRQSISTKILYQLFERSNQVSSYHMNSKISSTSGQFEMDYVDDITQFKRATIKWDYNNHVDNIDFIYNQDNIFVKFDSQQFMDYIAEYFSKNSPYSKSKSELNLLKANLQNNALLTGESYLHFDKAFMESVGPSKESEEEILESNRLVREQIIASLRLRKVPSVIKEDKEYYLKIPLKIEYNELNSILYPSVKSYIVNNQEVLKNILSDANIDIYMDKQRYISKIIITSEPLTLDQAESIFIDNKANSFNDLSRYMVKISTENELSMTINFTAYNEPVSIAQPSNAMSTQEAMIELQSLLVPPKKTISSKYTVNNSYPHKSVDSSIFKDFSMVHNMLFRYYNEHGIYPSTLDSLSNSYFPGSVPGNSQTGQGFSYRTFDNYQGYQLCPTAGSSREYCYKKFKLNEIN